MGLTIGIVLEIRYPGLPEADIDYFFDSFGFLVILPITLPSLSCTARRFHDFGHSGWIQIGFYFVLGILEIMNTTQGWILYAIAFVSFYVYASQKPIGENKYGAVIQ